jgi:two-component system osmolarity sensor histidine kinase EnvZ
VKLRSPSLFWRTFLLILLLIVASLLAWLQSFRAFEREPRAQQIANQVISIVNVTRSALLYSDPRTRAALLAELADNEGIRIVPLEPADAVVPLHDAPLVRLVAAKIVDGLGPQTRLAGQVNGIAGIWVSFGIDGDAYWVFIERDPLTRDLGTQWIRWAVLSLLLSLLAAVAITRVVNQPLKKLSDLARELGAGRTPAPLPETGPAEIGTVNASFNRMVADLDQLERDRAVLLAGVSHDLRTPLTRLRLELDMARLPDEARLGMIGDIEQMDSIVRQFLDYARRQPQHPAVAIELSVLLHERLLASRLRERDDVSLQVAVASGVVLNGHRTELARAIDNLLSNAERYGRDPGSGQLALEVSLRAHADQALLAVADRGTGIAPAQLDRVRRPFERGESARTGSGGAGLGLAIVERVAELHRGRLQLEANRPHGLRATLILPLHP